MPFLTFTHSKRAVVLPTSKTIRYTPLSLRDLAISFGPVILLAVALLAVAYWWLDPNPPKRMTLATGPAQSAYEEFGKRYVKALQANGITVEPIVIPLALLPTLSCCALARLTWVLCSAAPATIAMATKIICRH